MRVGDNAFGVLALTTAGDCQLGPDARALMQGVADEVAVALENARLAEERTQLEAARQMEVLRAELLASVSHELRTPLGFIKGYTTSLLRKAVTWEPEEQREFLEIIDEETDHLTEMVDGILDVARARAGRLELRLDSVDLEQVVRRSLERMSSTLEQRDVRLIADGSATVAADDVRLQQVVVNLLQNAAKYSPEATPIELRLDIRDGMARLAVLDRGVGVSAADTARIFEPFYRVQDRRTARVGGAGLGLAICRAIVDGHGGRIWAEPRAGGGSRFCFSLPAS
jgi:two-component system sensor histidine kinase KdpD